MGYISPMKIVLTDFVLRQFKQSDRFSMNGGTVINLSAETFEWFLGNLQPQASIPGYAPFCQLLFFNNFADALVGVMPINDETRPRLCSGYSARRESELPVLSRWFEGVTPERAQYLCVIVYSKEQLASEGDHIDGDFGVVSVNAQNEPFELPMPPATMVRNALGVAEGGSGVPLDRDKYMLAVEYWNNHAVVKQT